MPVVLAASTGARPCKSTNRTAVIAGSFERRRRARNWNWCLSIAVNDTRPDVKLNDTLKHRLQRSEIILAASGQPEWMEPLALFGGPAHVERAAATIALSSWSMS